VVGWLYEQILRFDVPMADTCSVDVGKGTERLVSVEFDEEGRYGLFDFLVMFHDPEDSLGNIVHD